MRSIAVSENKKIIWNIKHVDIHYHHIRNFIQNSMIEILHIFSRNMMINELMKILSIIKFKEFCSLIELLKESLNIDKNNNDSFDEDFDNWMSWIRLNWKLYRQLFIILHSKVLKILKWQKDLKNEDASMRLALYKSYFMSNLTRIGLNYTVNFVWKFHKLLVASGGVRIVIRL